jgi:DNA-directed RNA polymerase alpha subunit
MSAPSNVHFAPPVSLEIIQIVVEQGLCKIANSIRRTALSNVQGMGG